MFSLIIDFVVPSMSTLHQWPKTEIIIERQVLNIIFYLHSNSVYAYSNAVNHLSRIIIILMLFVITLLKLNLRLIIDRPLAFNARKLIRRNFNTAGRRWY